AGLAKGYVDAVWTGNESFGGFKLTAPGSAKKIRSVGCETAGFNAPFLIKKDVNSKPRGDLLAMVLSVHKDPAFKSMQPLFKRVNFMFQSAKAEDYKELFALLKKADLSDFHALVKSQGL